MPLECPGGLLFHGIQCLASEFAEPGLVAKAPHSDATTDLA